MNLSFAAGSQSSLTWHENLVLFDRTYECGDVTFNHLMGKPETAGEIIDYLRWCFAFRKLFQNERGNEVETKYLAMPDVEDGCAISGKGGANRVWDSVHINQG